MQQCLIGPFAAPGRPRLPGSPSCAVLLALVAAVGAVLPPSARANGDPPSDVLLSQDVYFPYGPPTDPRLRDAVTRLLRRTRAAGYPMKVALVTSEADLGSYGRLLLQPPQAYAEVLASELRTVRHGRARTEALHLLVVMPFGFGGTNLGDRVDEALAPVPIEDSAGSDGLAKAALEAVARIATANGHRIAVPPEADVAVAPRGDKPGDSRSSLLLFFLAPAVALLVALVVGRYAGRRNGFGAPDESGDPPVG